MYLQVGYWHKRHEIAPVILSRRCLLHVLNITLKINLLAPELFF